MGQFLSNFAQRAIAKHVAQHDSQDMPPPEPRQHQRSNGVAAQLRGQQQVVVGLVEGAIHRARVRQLFDPFRMLNDGIRQETAMDEDLIGVLARRRGLQNSAVGGRLVARGKRGLESGNGFQAASGIRPLRRSA